MSHGVESKAAESLTPLTCNALTPELTQSLTDGEVEDPIGSHVLNRFDCQCEVCHQVDADPGHSTGLLELEEEDYLEP